MGRGSTGVLRRGVAGLAAAIAPGAGAQLVPQGDARFVHAHAEAAIGATVQQETDEATPNPPLANPWNARVGVLAMVTQSIWGSSAAQQHSVIDPQIFAGILYATADGRGGPPGGAGGTSTSEFRIHFRIFQTPVQVRLVGRIEARHGSAVAMLLPVVPPVDFTVLNSAMLFSETRTLNPGQYTIIVSTGTAADSNLGPPASVGSATFFLTTNINECLHVIEQPGDVRACPGGDAEFVFGAAGAPGTTFQWRRGGTALADGPTPWGSTISGATTDRLTISGCTAMDAGAYDCVAAAPCRSETSTAAMLVFCMPNCDCSTAAPVLNVNDFICFQTRFAAGDPYANCDGSTGAPVLNVNDFVCFQSRFAAGCP